MQLIPLLINFTSFAQLQIKDKLRTFPRREGFTRNKRKSSALICFGPFVPHPILPSPSGKASLNQTTELRLWEMNFIRRLRRHLPLRGKVKHP